MPTINQLTRVTELSAGDLFPLFATSDGDARAAALSLLQKYMQDNLDFSQGVDYITQYAAPNATGFTVVLTDGASNNKNIHLILTPTGAFAAGSITLPAKSGLADKQEVIVNSTQNITAFSYNLNGAAAAVGAPATLGPNGFFRLKYDAVTTNWYRIG